MTPKIPSCRDSLPERAAALLNLDPCGLELSYTPAIRSRHPSNGHYRGWGIQYGKLDESISSENLYKEAINAAYNHDLVFSILPEARLKNIYWILTRDVINFNCNNVFEFGVYRGGTSIFMAYILSRILSSGKVYGLDTFRGIPACDEALDAHRAGDFSDVSLSVINARAAKLGLSNFHPVTGNFSDTYQSVAAKSEGIALAHIDCDTYASVKAAIDLVWPDLIPGGFLILDDADASSCIGATQAMEEMVMERKIFSEQAWPHFVFRKDGHAG